MGAGWTGLASVLLPPSSMEFRASDTAGMEGGLEESAPLALLCQGGCQASGLQGVLQIDCIHKEEIQGVPFLIFAPLRNV